MKKYLLFFLLALVILPLSAHGKAIDKYIKDGKFVLRSIKPDNADDMYIIIEDIYPDSYENMNDLFYLGTNTYDEQTHQYIQKTCNDDLTKCYFTSEYNGETIVEEYDMVYQYDKDIKKLVDRLVSKIPSDKDQFFLTDMELVSFVYNEADDQRIASFCGELKKYIEYMNFSIDVRMGDGDPFISMGGGASLFIYDNTVYYYGSRPIEILSRHEFYVPDGTTDVVAAMKERLNKNFKGFKFDIVEMTPEGFIQDYSDYLYDVDKKCYNDPDTCYVYTLDNMSSYSNADEYATAKRSWNEANILNEYTDENGYNHFVMSEEKIYRVYINDKGTFKDYLPLYFVVRKDSSKMVDNTFITVDSESNIVISTTETIPLDTLIKVSKITSGETYDRIINLLSISNGEMFDLSLFSKVTGKSVTKLDDGKFEVRIPISDNLKGKELVVYYVDDNNNITKYEVEIDGDYAVFKTNHFSIYTLAENTSSSTTEETQINNPPTLDNITTYFVMTLISALGLGFSIKKIKTN